MTILEFCEWLESTAFGAIARESLYGFQVLAAIHILGIALSVGTLFWVDLRMLGIALVNSPLSSVYRTFAPWFILGFGTMIASGTALFAGFATSAYGNTFFRIKLAAMTLAGVNALVFHVASRGLPAAADAAQRPSTTVQLAGLASITLWAIVIVCGRMISYTLF